MDASVLDFMASLVEVTIAVGSLLAFFYKLAVSRYDKQFKEIVSLNQKVLESMEQQREQLKATNSKLESHEKDIENLTKTVRHLEAVVNKLQGQIELIVKTMIRSNDDDAKSN